MLKRVRIQEALRKRLPASAWKALGAVYAQRPSARRERRGWRDRQRVAEMVVDQLGQTVRAGPFTGLRFISTTADTPSKLVGSYECELHPTTERLIERQFAVVVNVGCAEGYYAVGMALRCPSATVRAYDIDQAEQDLCRATAEANGVPDRVLILGKCTKEDLLALDRKSLVLMDCEGCEDALLDPRISATVLVELHDWDDATLPDRVIARFAGSHTVSVIESAPRITSDYPQLNFLSHEDHTLALFERWTPMRWALITPHASI